MSDTKNNNENQKTETPEILTTKFWINLPAENDVKKAIDELAQDNINKKSDVNKTILHYAVIRNQVNYVDYILKKDADPSIQDNDGDTPLHIACRYKYTSIIKSLLKKDKTILNIKNKNGDTPLHIVIKNRQENIIDEILKSHTSFDINEKDGQGKTLLDLAIEYDLSGKVVKHLMSNGVEEKYTKENINKIDEEYSKNKETYKKEANDNLNNINIIASISIILFIITFISVIAIQCLSDNFYQHFNSIDLCLLLPIDLLITVLIFIKYKAYSQNNQISNNYNHKRTSLTLLRAIQYEYNNDNISTDNKADKLNKIDEAIINIINLNPTDINKKNDLDEIKQVTEIVQSLAKTSLELKNITK